jgi:uncharacterized protein (DUF58 family)
MARTDKVFVKKYEEETNLRCQLVIDASSSMYFPPVKPGDETSLNKIRFAVFASAALIQLLRMQRDAAGLSIFADRVFVNERARSNAVHLRHLMGQLERRARRQRHRQAHHGGERAACHRPADPPPQPGGDLQRHDGQQLKGR